MVFETPKSFSGGGGKKITVQSYKKKKGGSMTRKKGGQGKIWERRWTPLAGQGRKKNWRPSPGKRRNIPVREKRGGEKTLRNDEDSSQWERGGGQSLLEERKKRIDLGHIPDRKVQGRLKNV